ncbi:uncharacterized protein LOC130496903 [Raphanus sativus]|uniref:Uncharacterized protein LOC130496903 n=1 Tax=Raphanus sativus TaxID=3726 RepID=A0A9W3C286_RAPSA|nr:uncharacterized protein LOC130496903 [Raphanus sativus]
MHIEKNFFDNLMNTILNVQAAKDAFFDWISKDVEFPDGYASNLGNCVDRREGKFTGLKSHDCHVMMQRLLPFAFKELLPKNVYEAVAGISAFFRDLCTRSVTPECIENLKTNIAVIKVEGSIVAQFIRAETSNFAEHYFPGEVQTKSRKPARHDDRGERATYYVTVPDIFTDVGRLSGKPKNRQLTEEEHSQLQIYLLTNCEDVFQYERIFMAEKRFEYRHATEEELEALKMREFAGWMRTYVSDGMARGETINDWLREMIWGPKYVVKSYPRFASRGYAFTTSKRRRSSKTYNAGVCSAAGDDVYYGNIREILEIVYPGMVGLRCTVFYCDWYDNTPDRGVTTDAFGVTSVHSRRKLPYYDPFILASQADQVCYIKYPRVTNRDDPWVTVTALNPRSRVQGSSELEDPLQPNTSGNLSAAGDVAAVDLVIDFTDFGDEAVVHVEDEPEIGEFHQDPDSDSSGGDDGDSGSEDEPEIGE